MKTFEEKWTAWIDDQLAGQELVDFEASLPDKAAAEAEKLQTKKLGTLLKRELGAQALNNEEFFSHQIRERILHEGSAPGWSWRRNESSGWGAIGRLFWTGATAMAIFVALAVFVLRDKQPAEPSQYLTQILQAKVDPVTNPNATITIFEAKEDRVTVLWTEGLKSLPADYAAK